MKIYKKIAKQVKMNCVCGHSEMIAEHLLHTFFSHDNKDCAECLGSICSNCLDNVVVSAKLT